MTENNDVHAKLTIDRINSRPRNEDVKEVLSSIGYVSPDMTAMDVVKTFMVILEHINEWDVVDIKDSTERGSIKQVLFMKKRISVEDVTKLTGIPLDRVRTTLDSCRLSGPVYSAIHHGIYAQLGMGNKIIVIAELKFWYDEVGGSHICVKGGSLGELQSAANKGSSSKSHPTLTNPENKFVKKRIDFVMADALVGALTSIYTESNHTFEGYITDLVDSGHVFVTTQPKLILDELKANKLHNVFLEDIEFLLTAPKKKCK